MGKCSQNPNLGKKMDMEVDWRRKGHSSHGGKGRMVEPVFSLSDGDDSNTELRIAESSNCLGKKADVAKGKTTRPYYG